MEKKRIVWIDDDIDTPILRPYIDIFEENKFEVIKIKEINNNLLPVLKEEAKKSLAAILIDIIMPPQDLDFYKTRAGLRTGIVVLEDIIKEDSLRQIPIIVCTNAEDVIVTKYCKDKSLLYINKKDYFAEDLVNLIDCILTNK